MQQTPMAPIFATGWQKHPPNAPAHTLSSNHGPPPDGSDGPKAMTGITQQVKPEMFDLTIGDTIMDANRDTERELVEHARRRKQKTIDIVQIVNHNLGPSHIQSANPSYVDTLARQAIPARQSATPVFEKGWDEWKTGEAPAKPEFQEGWNKWETGQEPASSSGTVPSGIGAKHEATSGKAVKALTSRQAPYGTGSGKGKGVKKPNELVLHMVSPQPETPAGMAPPPDGKPPPSSGKGRIKKSEAAAKVERQEKRGRFAKPDNAKVRASLLTNLKAQREKKAKSAPKLDPAPVPEIVAPKSTGKGRPMKGAIIGKQSVPEIVATAKAKRFTETYNRCNRCSAAICDLRNIHP